MRERAVRRSVIVAAVFLVAVSVIILWSKCSPGRKPENLQKKPMTTTEAVNPPNDPLSIHRRAIIVDMHADTTQRLVDENVDLQKQLADGHLDAVRAQQGGLDAQFFSIWVDPDLFGGGGATAMKRADV